MIILSKYRTEAGAAFSDCKKFRYALWRFWDKEKPAIMFIGLNPSTANETENDPTIRRVIAMAKSWGYGGVYMMNCFPFVSTDPNLLQRQGLFENDKYLVYLSVYVTEIVFAWGNFAVVSEMCRDFELKKLFPTAKCLIKNKNGSPRHPLYVPSKTPLIIF